MTHAACTATREKEEQNGAAATGAAAGAAKAENSQKAAAAAAAAGAAAAAAGPYNVFLETTGVALLTLQGSHLVMEGSSSNIRQAYK